MPHEIEIGPTLRFPAKEGLSGTSDLLFLLFELLSRWQWRAFITVFVRLQFRAKLFYDVLIL